VKGDKEGTKVNKLGKIKIVLPGDLVSQSEKIQPGEGVYRCDGGLYANRLGILHFKGDSINIKPLVDVYIPSPGDKVVGKIVDIGLDHWMVDINANTPYSLGVWDSPWKIGFGHVGNYLNIGDVIIARVERESGSSRMKLSMNGAGLKKLKGGYLAWINVSKIPVLVGRDKETIGTIRNRTHCRIIIGQNGVLWIEGDPTGIAKVVRVMKLIDEMPHTVSMDGIIEDILEGDRG